MKNILLLSTLQEDTLNALKTALAQAEDQPLTIVLMLLHETPNDVSAAFWLRKMQSNFTPFEESILAQCQQMASFHPNCKLRIQQQFSLSGPLLRHLMETFEIGLIIVPQSFLKSTKSQNKYCLQLLKKGHTPILQLPAELEESRFSKALYLENEESNVPVADLPKMAGGHFSFRIISQAKIFDLNNQQEMTPVYNTIHKNGIDLLIETRKPKKIRTSQKNKPALNDHFGLPVLSVCESAY
ncbi:hypothetical protein [Flavobacterium sp.]|uniref:hypothetical protein n=1 Tax=Flavobacterium sp. TaxID=239 RepID=UPI0039E4E953